MYEYAVVYLQLYNVVGGGNMEEEKKDLDKGAIGMWMILGGLAGIILLIVLVYLAGNSINDIGVFTSFYLSWHFNDNGRKQQ